MNLDVVVDTYKFLFHLFNCCFQFCNMVTQSLQSSCKIKCYVADIQGINQLIIFQLENKLPRGVAWLRNASMPLPLLEGF